MKFTQLLIVHIFISLSFLEASMLDIFETEDVTYFNGRNKTESQEETKNSTDSADKGDLSDFLFGDVLCNVRILDVDADFDQVFSRVLENLIL